VTTWGKPAERGRSLFERVTFFLGHRDVAAALRHGLSARWAEVSTVWAVRVEDVSGRVEEGSRRGVFTA
jgi:hypothetical protein